MAENQDIFGASEAKETKDSASINKAGIHRNMTYIGCEIKKLESKSGSSFTVTGLTFQNPDGIKFDTSIFRPPVSEEDCKPYSKAVWKNGKDTGEKVVVSAKEVFKQRNQDYLYLLMQLGMAVSKQTWVQVMDKLKKHTSSYEELTAGFIKNFPPNNVKHNNIDIKLIWENDHNKKTSFLKLAKAGEYNKIFGVFIPGQPSFITMSDYELRNNSTRMYFPAAPRSEGEGGEQTHDSSDVAAEQHFDENNISANPEDVEDIF
jgi:hypothetical protein